MMGGAAGPVATPSLAVEPGSGAGNRQGVIVLGLGPSEMAALRDFQAGGGALESLLRVQVFGAEGPDVAGRCQLLEAGLRLVPHFPFQPGLAYRVTFASGLDGLPGEALHLVFRPGSTSIPPSTVVDGVFPSGDGLPENLLRFYVCFSNPMQRGHAEAEIMLLGSDGQPAPDVLYRSPAELWNPGMRVLTLLLDPGRLKRGVGPNRELGAPLEPGQAYTLVIGAGMTDLFGRRLETPVHKRFVVGTAARTPIATSGWTVVPPAPGGREPLVIVFAAALDWAMLFNAITVVTAADEPVPGRVAVDQREMRWYFTPSAPWAAGMYRIRVDPGLEDPCGNTPIAAFDRPLRTGVQLRQETGVRPILFAIT